VGGLGEPGEQFEGLLGGAVLLGDEDALGLLDDGAGFHRPPHVLGQRRGGLVEVGVGDGDGGVAGEGPGQLDGVPVEYGGLGGVDIECAEDGFLERQGHRQGGVHAGGEGLAGECWPAGLGRHVGDGDGPGRLGDLEAGAEAVLVLRLVQVQGQLTGESRGEGPVGLDQGDRGADHAGQRLPGQLRDPAEDGLQVTFTQLQPAEFGESDQRVKRRCGDDSSSARQGICQLSTRRLQGRHPSGGALYDRDSGRDRRRAVYTRWLAASRRRQPQDPSLSAPVS